MSLIGLATSLPSALASTIRTCSKIYFSSSSAVSSTKIKYGFLSKRKDTRTFVELGLKTFDWSICLVFDLSLAISNRFKIARTSFLVNFTYCLNPTACWTLCNVVLATSFIAVSLCSSLASSCASSIELYLCWKLVRNSATVSATAFLKSP